MKIVNRKFYRLLIFSILLFLISGSLSPLAGQENANTCDSVLFKIGRQLRLFEIATGKLPEKLSNLYTRGFVKQLDDFQCSKTEPGIKYGGEIDDKTHFGLLPEPGTEETDPILVTKATAGTPQRALLRNGEIIDWGKKETPEVEGTVVADQPSTSDQPRSEAQKKLDQELLEAAQKGELDRVKKALQAGADVNAKGKAGSTALGWAASKGHEDMVQLLIKSGADIKWEAPQGQTALHVAAHQGQAAVIRILLSSGADVNQKIKSTTAPKRYQGATALFMAVENNKAEAIQVLLQSGANVNAINSFGATPLMFSVGSQNLEPLRTLIEAGADLNAKIKADAGPGAGSTALMGAVIQGNLLTAKVLILAGADVKAKDAQGNTAFDYAKKKSDTDIVRILREPNEAIKLAKKGLEPDMMRAIKNDNTSIVKWLLQLGLNADASDEKGITALMRAIENGSVEMVRALLNSGADVNAADREFGTTPLMLAASKDKGEISKFLIQSGAEVNRQAKGDNRGKGAGWTALMAAAMVGDADLVSHLLSAGGKAGLTNDAGKSALDIAKKEGNKEVVQLLNAATRQTPRVKDALTKGLVAYYPFNGNSNDESGNKKHGTVKGAVLTEDRFGNPNSAYSFDGKDDYIDTPVEENLQQTIVAWIKPDSSAEKAFMTIVDSDKCRFYGQGIEISYPGKTHRHFQVDTHNAFYDTKKSVEWDTWQQIITVYRKGNVRLYHNGALIHLQDYPQKKLDGKTYTIGNHCKLGSGQFKGMIDDIHIYNRPLSQSEIQDLYRRTLNSH